jgi:arylsulfatase A-like enzyme
MNRRKALQAMAAAGTGAMLSQCATPAEAAKKNIIFIMTDDQTVDQMSCYGHPFLKTPNMDRLANEGTRFNHCFCNNSLCAPARASVLTGCYSNINGIRGNTEKKGEVEQLNPDLKTFPELLQDSGYYTALVGKYHIRQDPKGFDTWKILNGQGAYFDAEFIENGVSTPSEGYVADIITDKTLKVLGERDKEKPFCLVYQHKGPHRPFTPAPRHAHLWDDLELPYPETFDDDYSTRRIAKLSTDMRIEESLAKDYDDMPEGMSTEEKRKWIYQRFVKDSCLAVMGVDENLGRVLEYLENEGIKDDTIIIYTSDNGFYLGEYGWYDKRFMYEPSLHLPLVISHPGIGKAGQVVDEMVSNTDFAPTILDLAGVAVPASMHGKSMLPILEGNTPSDWRKYSYYEYYENSWELYKNLKPEDINDTTNVRYFNAHRVTPHRGVRSDRYKLIEFHTEDYWELFDLEADPNELKNVYGKPGYEDITAELLTELRKLQSVYGDGVSL